MKHIRTMYHEWVKKEVDSREEFVLKCHNIRAPVRARDAVTARVASAEAILNNRRFTIMFHALRAITIRSTLTMYFMDLSIRQSVYRR